MTGTFYQSIKINIYFCFKSLQRVTVIFSKMNKLTWANRPFLNSNLMMSTKHLKRYFENNFNPIEYEMNSAVKIPKFYGNSFLFSRWKLFSFLNFM